MKIDWRRSAPFLKAFKLRKPKWEKCENDGSWSDDGYYYDYQAGPFTFDVYLVKGRWVANAAPYNGDLAQCWSIGFFKTRSEAQRMCEAVLKALPKKLGWV